MKPINVQIGNDLRLLVVPDSEAHMDGHPVLTYIYDIFKDTGVASETSDVDEECLVVQKQSDPDYMGHIRFEHSENVFLYVADGNNALTNEEVKLVIEHINYYRNSPQLWIV